MFTASEYLTRTNTTVSNLVDYALGQEADFGEGLEFIGKFSETNQRDACALAVELATEHSLRSWVAYRDYDGLLADLAEAELSRRRERGLLAPVYACEVVFPDGFYGEVIRGECEVSDGVCRGEHKGLPSTFYSVVAGGFLPVSI